MTNNYINWMPNLNKIFPIQTSGNGNCLLHAVLIAMIGLHDFHLNLRDQLIHFVNENKSLLKEFWIKQRYDLDQLDGICSDATDLDKEWDEVCDLVRYENSGDGQITRNLRYLESIHIFTISNLLRRPIIVYSDAFVRNRDGDAISENYFHGIYLPILREKSECIRYPIVLFYDNYHFCPLQPKELITERDKDRNQIPLYLSATAAIDKNPLPIRFISTNNDQTSRDSYLSEYLHLRSVNYFGDHSEGTVEIICAQLGVKTLQKVDNMFRIFYNYCRDFHDFDLPETIKREDQQRFQSEMKSDFASNEFHSSNVDAQPVKKVDFDRESSFVSNLCQPTRHYGRQPNGIEIVRETPLLKGSPVVNNLPMIKKDEQKSSSFTTSGGFSNPSRLTNNQSNSATNENELSLKYVNQSISNSEKKQDLSPKTYVSIPVTTYSTSSPTKPYSSLDYQNPSASYSCQKCAFHNDYSPSSQICESCYNFYCTYFRQPTTPRDILPTYHQPVRISMTPRGTNQRLIKVFCERCNAPNIISNFHPNIDNNCSVCRCAFI